MDLDLLPNSDDRIVGSVANAGEVFADIREWEETIPTETSPQRNRRRALARECSRRRRDTMKELRQKISQLENVIKSGLGKYFLTENYYIF